MVLNIFLWHGQIQRLEEVLEFHQQRYSKLSNNALRAYQNCKDKKFKKFWLKVYKTIEERNLTLITIDKKPS